MTSRDKAGSGSRRRSVIVGVTICGLAAAALVLLGVVRRGPAPEMETEVPPELALGRPAPVSHDYAGSAACRECHADVCDAYAAHPMSRSIQEKPAALRHAVEFASAGTVYRVDTKDGRMRHHEIRRDQKGDVLYDQSEEIAFALGSGQRGRSYVINREGRLFLSPIAWYSQKDRWDLSPGFQPGHHPRFEREATDRCLSCHVGRMSFPDDAGRFPSPQLAEASIGCERCHGPARGHVDYQKPGKSSPASDPILKLSGLTQARRDAVCNQCHLSGMEQVLRYGRGDFDFRPGMALADIWTVFIKDALVSGGRAQAVSQVEQMHDSACWKKTDGRLGCVSCHNPHEVPAVETRDAFFSRRCAACHDQHGCSLPLERRQEKPFQDSCIACHMPRLAAGDVPHTTQTDHRIRRRPEASKGAAPRSAELAAFEEPGAYVPAWESDRARGIVLARRAEAGDRTAARESESLLRPLLESLKDDAPLRDALAIDCVVQGRAGEAADLWRQVLNFAPHHQSSLLSLAMHHQGRQQWEQALGYWDRLVSLNAGIADWHGRRAQALRAVGRRTEALEASRRGLQLNPSQPAAYLWQAELLDELQQSQEAERLRALAGKLKSKS